MPAMDICDWFFQRLPFSLMLGEICLWRFKYDCIRYAPDIFSSSPLISMDPPIVTMLKKNVKLAYASSCPISKDIGRLSVKDKCLCLRHFAYKHYYVETKGDFEKYLSLKKKKTVSGLRRKVRKIEATNVGTDSFEVFTTPEQIEEFLKLATPISEKSYQQRLFGQGLPKTQKFKDTLLENSKNGNVFGYIVKIYGKPVAYTLCPVYGKNKVLYDQTGYDPEYTQYSPGTVLQFKLIEDLFKRQEVDYYDLCSGEGLHKELFATGYILCGNLYFFQINSMITFFFFIDFILSSITGGIKSILSLLGLKAIVKKIIRRSA